MGLHTKKLEAFRVQCLCILGKPPVSNLFYISSSNKNNELIRMTHAMSPFRATPFGIFMLDMNDIRGWFFSKMGI